MSETIITPTAPVGGLIVQPGTDAESGPPRISAAGLFVGLVWLAMLLMAVGFVFACGSSTPYWDEWDQLPQVVEGPFHLGAWLWAQHNEHRFPLPRLVFWAVGRLSGWDMRICCLVTVAGLALLALVCVRAAAKLRGRTSFADAFFPVVLLQLGQYENFLMGYQVNFMLTAVLVGLFLLVVVRTTLEPMTWRDALTAAGCLALLPLCGTPGILWVPGLGLWLGLAAWHGLGDGSASGRWRGGVLLAGTVAAILVTFLCLHGREPVARPEAPGTGAVFTVALQVLGLAFGWSGALLDPAAGWLVAVGLLTAAAALVVAFVRQPTERLRLAGLLVFLGSTAVLALAIGWGRSGGSTTAGLASRYVTLVAPVTCALYFAAALYGGRVMSSFLPMALFTAACLLTPLTARTVAAEGRLNHEKAAHFLADAKLGMPASILGERYTYVLHPDGRNIARGVRGLKQDGVAAFATVPDDLPLDLVPIPKAIRGSHRAITENGVIYGRGPDSYLTYKLPAPRPIQALRFRCVFPEGVGPSQLARVKLVWRSARDGAEHEQVQLVGVPLTDTNPRRLSFWLADTVQEFRLVPDDKPWACRIDRQLLLVTPTAVHAP